jgi:hypothetical protein
MNVAVKEHLLIYCLLRSFFKQWLTSPPMLLPALQHELLIIYLLVKRYSIYIYIYIVYLDNHKTIAHICRQYHKNIYV